MRLPYLHRSFVSPMKRYYTVVLLVFVLFGVAPAQTNIQTPREADSLRRVIALAQRDTVRINAMNDLSGYFWRITAQYDSSLVYAREAWKIAERLGFRRGIARAARNIGTVHYFRGKYDEALESYLAALRISEELNDKNGTASALNNIAIVYYQQGKYSDALDYYFKSLRLSEEVGNKIGISNALGNIAIVRSRQGKYREALEYLFKSLRIKEELGDKWGTANTLLSIAIIHNDDGKYDEAAEYNFKALRLQEELGDKSGIASVLSNIANVYEHQGKYEKATEYNVKALRLQEELGDKAGKTTTLNSIASVYVRRSRYDSALVYARRSLALADSVGARLSKKVALETLSVCYDSLGQHKQALEYFRHAMMLKDSLVNAENLKKASELKEQYEAEQREQKITILNKEKALQESELKRQTIDLARSAAEQRAQQQSILVLKQMQELSAQQQEADLTEAFLRDERNKQALALAATEREFQRANLERQRVVQWSLAAILVAVIAATLWLMSLYRQKLSANAEILRQNALLEEQAAEITMANTALNENNAVITNVNHRLQELITEKDEILGIVSHDLKNPIAVVRGLAELIENKFVEGEQTVELSGRIVGTADRMLELVKNILEINHLESGLRTFATTEVDVCPILEATVWQYESAAAAKNISLHYSSESEAILVVADEQAMMQVFDNIISNAVKYSPLGKNVFVRVRVCEQKVRVEVQDEGEGISPEDMKKLFGKFTRLSARPTGGEHSTGLGLSIVKKMVEAMNGRVWCESELNNGATFMIELPSPQ